MIGIEQRIAQLVVFIGELNGGLLEYNAFLHAVVLGEGAGSDVADDDFQGNDGDLLHQGLPLGQLLDKVGGNALLFQIGHQAVAHLVVDDALARNGAFFQPVESGGVVLVIHDQKLGIVGGENLFGLALIQLLQFFHLCLPPYVYSLSVSGNGGSHLRPPSHTL